MTKALDEIVSTLQAADNEATESPYWLIIDPIKIYEHTFMEDGEVGYARIAAAINGPFFCREDAEAHLKATAYNHSPDAIVWCASGYHSQKYKALCRSLRIGMGDPK